MTRLRALLLALALAAAAGLLGPWLDGQPSETEVARAVAADVRAAQLDAARSQRLERAEADMRREELLQRAARQQRPHMVAAATEVRP